jgi:hypothetical protein
MNVYKLTLLATDWDDEGNPAIIEINTYADVSKLIYWYVPLEEDYQTVRGITLVLQGDALTVKQEPHIMEFLTKWSKYAIKE